MKTLINIADQSTVIPDKLGEYDNPNADTLLAHGWRYADPDGIPALADGYTRSAIQWEDSGDGVNAVAVYQDRANADITAEQYAARCADFQRLIPHAYMFRALMRQYFGDNAETNRDITREVVEGYFLTAPNLTIQGVQHGMTLQGLFAELSTWNGTGETWSLPWEIVP